MTVVAVAGGSAGLGRSIVEEISQHAQYDALVLSRTKPETADAGTESAYRTISVDYTSIQSLVAALEKHRVHTVISTIGSVTSSQEELNLMRAADLSETTVRYIPSVWGSFPYSEEQALALPVVRMKCDIIQAIKKTSLEYTIVYNGYFLDYYGNNRVKSNVKGAPVAIDVAHDIAAIPGTGNTPVAFTHSNDVAKYVVANLAAAEWTEESYIIGDKVTWNEFLELAQNAKGVKFNTVYDPVSSLKLGKVTELPSHKPVYDFWPKEQFQWKEANFGVWFEQGLFDLQPAKTLNDTFPEIKAITVKEFLEVCWQGA